MNTCPEEGRRRQLDLLTNLADDLAVLENTWQNKRMSAQKAANHLGEVLESVQVITQAESLEQFENICLDIRDKLHLILNKKVKLEKRQWAMISELIALVKQALEDDNSAAASSTAPEKGEMPGQAGDGGNGLSGAVKKQSLPGQEENQMNKALQVNAQELLQRAQQALLSGNAEEAKNLAMQAAEAIAKAEAEAARKVQKALRADLESAAQEEAEAEEILARIAEEKKEREAEIDQTNAKLAEARSSFTEQQHACLQIKEQVEKIEANIAALNEQRKHLLEQFQESLPARDAAERECGRLKKEVEKLAPEMEIINDSLNAAESQLAKSRQKKESLQADLDKVMSKITI